MTSKEIRQRFLDFFKSKDHVIVPSAPIVVKDDPTLMFTNAGMNQFKDIFLGNTPIKYPRIANSQKCLRVSGKHNDLEEVGIDTYHHTMFEMLGNWSFGDYFKKEAIEWAWELLTKVYNIDPERLYVTIFEGSKDEGLEKDTEAFEIWKSIIPENRILSFSKKDNFWEMGETGPCGPCSEIHIDLREEEERKKVDGTLLVNKGHPLVIEIWNLVFIQYNRKSDGTLQPLPKKHIDTGMGLERLCMVLQGKKSNYDTDLFQPIIKSIEKLTGFRYKEDEKKDIAMRVIADHIRAISFAIADGQLPSNVKAGYVIRRILRRAVRYYYSFLNCNEPLLFRLVPSLIEVMGEHYPELESQKNIIQRVIHEEELSFLKTLENGMRILDGIIEKTKKSGSNIVSGKEVFELYDTYGFPFDLTSLILRENNLVANEKEFEEEMNKQKERSRTATIIEAGDWVDISENPVNETEFIGYDSLTAEIKILRYRKVKQKGKEFYQLVFDRTPFYAESGGQIGDKGIIQSEFETIEIIDTIKENNLIIHLANKLPEKLDVNFVAKVNQGLRIDIACNHSATHLLHFALRKILGKHVEQKGSLVCSEYLRFDFSHFSKLTDEEIRNIEKEVNSLIRSNLQAQIKYIPFDEAKKLGAMALFGEKYGDIVRVVQFGESIELCGGTHVSYTGQIGFFKIISESSIAAGIRRIEAITGRQAENYVYEKEDLIRNISFLLKNPKDITVALEKLIKEKDELEKEVDRFKKLQLQLIKEELLKKMVKINGINYIGSIVEVSSPDFLRSLSFDLKNKENNVIIALGAVIENKPYISLYISENIVKEKNLNANIIIKELANEIKGGGGGQPFFATAGGKDVDGLQRAIEKAEVIVKNLVLK